VMKISRVLSDLAVYTKNFSRSREGIFFTFIFPVILVAVFGSIFSGGSSGAVPLYVQNLSGPAPAAQQFMEALNSTHLVRLHFIPPAANLQTYITQNSITAALLIPSNFSQMVSSGTAVNLSFYYNPTQSSSQIAAQAINIVVENFNLHLSGAHSVVGVSEHTNSVVATSYIDFLVPGLIGFTILTSPMFSMTYVVSSYKKEKIFRQFSLTPLTRGEWILSKFIFFTFIALASAAEMIAIGYFLFNAHVTVTPLVIPFLLAGVILFVSLGTFAGSISRTEEGASVIGNIITFPMMFLAGTFFPVSIMPGWLQAVAHVLPLYYIIDGLNAVMVYSNFSGAMVDLAVSAVLAAVFFILAMSVFSWKEA